MESGYKLFTRDVVRRVTLQENRCRVYEVGVSYAGRTKKVTWRDGVRDSWLTRTPR
jgi:hypothetical protein